MFGLVLLCLSIVPLISERERDFNVREGAAAAAPRPPSPHEMDEQEVDDEEDDDEDDEEDNDKCKDDDGLIGTRGRLRLVLVVVIAADFVVCLLGLCFSFSFVLPGSRSGNKSRLFLTICRG